MRLHQPWVEDIAVWSQGVNLYSIRVKGRLGATCLAAFPEMVSQERGADSVLTGLLPDRSALFGVLTKLEALGLELIEIRRLLPNPETPETGKRFVS